MGPHSNIVKGWSHVEPMDYFDLWTIFFGSENLTRKFSYFMQVKGNYDQE